MRPLRRIAWLAAVAVCAVVPVATGVPESHPVGSWRTALSIVVRGTPEEVYDAMTGEVSGWWDHGFVEHPRSRFIDPRPGGGFTEIFDDAGNGVLHAAVIYAHRGKLLRMRGPFGFSGRAVDLVASWTYEKAHGDSTRVTVTCDMVGPIEGQNEANVVESVWHHFLVERFQPWYERGSHRGRPVGRRR